MRKFTTLIVLAILAMGSLMAQAPQKFTYQAVVRNTNNQLLPNTSVGVQVVILENGAGPQGNPIYAERHVATTNANGLVTLNIGEGNVILGNFSTINWRGGVFFLDIGIDPTGGSDYTIWSTQQLLSVPYALFANEAGNGFSGDYNDLTNKPNLAPVATSGNYSDLSNSPQIPQIPQNVSAFQNDAGYITMDSVPSIPTNVSAFYNDVPYLTSFTEQQVLSIRNDTIFLTGGSFVKLPAGFDGNYNSLTNKPNLAAVATSGSYNDLTGKPNLAPVATSGDYNDLSNRPQIPQIPQNVSAFQNDAGYITMDSVPSIPTNVSAFYNDVPYLTSFTEQQVLSLRNDTIFLTGGSFVKLPAGFDGNYNSLTNKPNLAPVATSGAYNDLTGKPNLATVATSGDYNDLSNRPQIPQIPQNISAFNNDAGYITGYTETDPQYNAWNKDYNDLINKPVIPTIPTNVSAFQNDAGYITMGSVPTIPTNVSAFQNDAGYITMDSVPSIPTNVSAFYNDVPYLTSFTEQQVLSIHNDTIFLTGGSFVKLPAGFDGDYNSLTNKPNLFDGNYNSLTNKPNLAPVATSGVYNDLTGKPNLAPVATSGDYNDLSNRPQIPQIPANVSAFNNDAGYITGYTETDPQYNAWNKDYNDLINKPVIPNAANNATLTIQRNGSTVGTFTADASVNETVNIAVPTTTSELTNNSSFVTADQLTSLIGLINHRMDSLQTVVSSQNAEISTLSHTVDSLRDILTPSSTGCTPWNTSVTNETACAFYVWHEEIYTQSGIYLYGCTNADGTNNMEALNLTIHQPDTTHLRAEACESYSWNNTTYTESGNYHQKLINKNGCDSVIVLHLTIFNGTHNVFTKDTCEYYVWNGQTYTESGIYTYAYTNADGCASVDTLHLTIYHGTHNVIKEIVCESYTWHDTLYTESGIYTYTYENEYGCASVDTLYLTVHYGTHNVESLNACGSYEWHGQTYTESGTYTYAYNNEYGCPSVDTLKVVVVLVDEKSCSLAPCVTDVDGNMYSTVQIGGQCWMRSNLRTTHYADGTAIPTGNISSTDPYYYDSQSNRLDLAIRGYHYNQPAVMHNQSSSTANPSGVQGVCPDGWHVPSENEWQQLITFVGSQVQNVCNNGYGNYIEIAKALASPTGWRDNGNTCQLGNDVNNNLTGFTAFPTGQWQNDMSCWGTDFVCTFWSSTAGRPFTPGTSPQIGNANGYYGFPVRCVYDISACGTEFEGTHNVETDTTCDSYTWHGQTYTESGAYTYPYKNIYGCASEDTLKLTIHHSTHNVDIKNLFGSYTWYDSIYTETGTYTYEYTNEHGCPSMDTLHLTRGYYPCPGTPTVTDHEGNVYNTVQIGNQCWTKENMRCTTSPSTGANIIIPGTGGSTSYVSKFARKPNAENGWVAGVTFYGILYNWNAAVDTFNTSFSETGYNNQYSQNAVSVTFSGHRRGICPQGWHVPSDAEWTQLTNYVSSQEQFLCDHNSANIAKALVSPTGWRINSDSCGVGNSSTNNQTGFTAVPSGYYTGTFPKFGYGAGFWSATQREDVNNIVWGRHIFTDNNPTGMTRADDFYKSREYSVRCLKDTFSSDGTECMGTHNVEIKKANNTYTWHGQTYTESGTYTNIYTNEDGCYSVDTLKLTIVFVDEKSCPGTPSVTDIDGNTYSTVQIGEQCWMRSNLRTTRYADGTAVPAGNSAYSETDPYYYDYENCFTLPERGYYYNWPAVMHGQPSSTTNPSEVQGICPDGWHVPSELEWKQMSDYLGNKREYYCSRYDYFSAASLASNTGWTYYGGVQCAPGDNTPHNATGFSAIPAGYYQLVGRIGYASYILNGADCTRGAYFWGSTENSADNAYYRAIDNMSSGFNSRNVSKDVGFSVRCVMNAETDSVDYTIDEKSCPGTATVTDIDGNTYGTVQIGEQCWMRSNLRATRYADGTAVPAGNMNFSKTEPYYYDFSGQGGDGTSQYFPLSKRGYLYNWVAAMHGAASSNTNPSQVQGICPDGWHVPSNEEWTQLENYVRSQSQYVCGGGLGDNSGIAKALTSTVGWKDYYGRDCNPGYNRSANNATGFNAMPVGIYAYNGYQSATEVTWFLSSTENDSASIHFCMLWYDGYYLGRFIEPKDKGYSVRCLRNDCGTHNVETVIVVDSPTYTWHGQTYNEDGTYTFAYFNEAGCRSVDTLKLKINYFTVDEKSCPGTPSVTDVDGNMYSTVQIGDQCWMRSNLRTTHYADGTAIPIGNNSSNTDPYYYDYSNQRFTLRERGYLYNWPAIMHNQSSSNTVPSNVQGICPNGWHLPSNAEWTELENYVKSQSQYRCGGNSNDIAKAMVSTYGWKNYNNAVSCLPGTDTATNNATGFSAIPAGLCAYGNLSSCYEDCFLWSATDYGNGSTTAWYRRLHNGNTNFPIDRAVKSHGCSVRCLKDTASSGGDTPCIGTHNVETESSCGNYTWHGQTYTQSGTYTYAYTNDSGCASVDTLHLTVNQPANPFVCGTDKVKDHQNNEYNTVQIGEQCWMKENMRCTTSPTTGTLILETSASGTSYTGKKAYYVNGNPDNTLFYGLLYNWNAAVDTFNTAYGETSTNSNSSYTVSVIFSGYRRGICPEGWHVPSDAEWTQLTDYVNSQEQYRCNGTNGYIAKALASPTGWSVNSSSCGVGNSSTNNLTGFTAVPAGFYNGSFNHFGIGVDLFSVTQRENISSKVWRWYMFTQSNSAGVSRVYDLYKNQGSSVRCLKDTTSSGGDTPCIGTHNVETESSCGNYTWHGQTYSESGTYTYAYTNNDGCASVDTLKLTIRHPVASTSSATAYESYTWNGQTYTQSGDYTQTLTAANGCDSVVTLHLTIYQPVVTTSSATACESYSWNGTTYTQSGDYTQTFTAANGCDSVVTLHLTVYQPVNTTSSATACESYTWHEQTYTQSGDYTYNYTNEQGCPCTETLNLTINHGSHNVFTETAEGSYTWHGQTYTQSGTYTYAYTNDSGCPSVDTLHLTVSSVTPIIPTDTVEDGQPCPGTPTVADHEGNVYNTVQIGTQCWTKENMRCTTSPKGYLRAGDTISYSVPYYYDDNTSPIPLADRGLLYNWVGALDTTANANYSLKNRRGICPVGWHVPQDGEWGTLVRYVSSQSNYLCNNNTSNIGKALASTQYWTETTNNNQYCFVGYNQSANNATGFSAVPAGCFNGSEFVNSGIYAQFCSSSSGMTKYLWSRKIINNEREVTRIYSTSKRLGLSVRCLKDTVPAIGSDTLCIGTHNVETENACESFTWHGQTYTQSGTYTYSYTNDNGCASMDTLFLTIYNGTHNTYTESAEGSYTWHGQTYTQSGTYTYSYTNDNGCPSMDTLFLTIFSNTPVLPIILVEDSLSCPGVPRVADHEGNIYNTVKIGNQCWTRENMRCTTSPSTGSSLLSEYSTAASKSASWHSSNTSQDSAYGLLYNWCAAVDTFLVSGGAPEVANATSSLKLYSTFNGYRRGICPIGWHVPSEQEWLQLLTYVYNQGFLCDDCHNPHLEDYNVSCIAKAMSSTTGWKTDNDECAVGYNTLSNNATGFNALPAGRYASGNYNSFGNYTYFWSSTEDYDRYSTWAYYTNWGYYYSNVERGETPKACKFSVRCVKDTTSTHDGGNPNPCIGSHNEESGSACNSYNWRGGTYTASGKYVYAYINAQGCPSADTLHLVIHKPTITTNSAAACESYNWHGQTLTESGTYTHNYENEFGCASTETLNLIIYHGTHEVFTAEDCESYTWHGTTYSASGKYTYAYTNDHGCPSMDTLYLAIKDHVNLTTAAGACEEYNWRGQTLTASGSYTANFTNDHGCSCTETLNLTIYHGTGTTYTETACTRYNWHDSIYDKNGEYTYAYSDEHGCPCVDTLRLTIGNPCAGTPTVTDHQGNVYNTVQIGSQCWTKENMRCTTSPTTGTLLLNMDHPDTLTYSGKMAYYVNHDPSTAATYGLLYNWNAAVDVWNQDYSETHISWWPDSAVNITFSGHRRGICPQGWHVPSDAEWAQMINYVKSQSEYVCGNSSDNIAKALAIDTGWVTSTIYEDLGQGYYDLLDSFGVQVGGECAVCNNQSSNNATCFSALPAGYYYGTDNIWNATGFDPNSSANFFSSTQMYQDDPNVDSSFSNMYIANAYGYGIFHFGRNVVRSATTKRYGNSVRCVKDSYSANGDVGYMDTNDAEIGKARKTNTPNEQTHTASSMGFRENPSEEPTEHIM